MTLSFIHIGLVMLQNKRTIIAMIGIDNFPNLINLNVNGLKNSRFCIENSEYLED